MIYFIPIFIFVIIFFIPEVTTLQVYGTWIKEKHLNIFFNKHLQEYKDESVSEKMFHGEISKPYIAKTAASWSVRWYVSDYGTIPRWSKWSKRLDAIHKEKYQKPIKLKIYEL